MRRLLLPALLATLVLAGCSGDDDPEPKIAPSDSSSAASTTAPPPSPTGPVEPTLPPEAAGEDAAAAEAFVRFYWDMVNFAQATGEVDALRSLGASTCAGCLGGLEGIERTYGSGGSIAGGQIRVSRANATRISANSGVAYSVQVDARAARQEITESAGAEPTVKKGGQFTFQFILQRQDDEWTVSRWDVMS